MFSTLVTVESLLTDILHELREIRRESNEAREEDKDHYERFHSLDEQKNKISEAGMLAVIEYMQKANKMFGGTSADSFAMKLFNDAAREMQKQKVKVEDDEYEEHENENQSKRKKNDNY